MRIQPYEQAAIVSTITRFDKESEIYLFGSRLDDTKRGGDKHMCMNELNQTGAI